MKITLIEHNNELYLVNDEEVKEGDWCFNIKRLNEPVVYPDKIFGQADYTANILKGTGWKKVLASEKSTPIGLIIPSDLMEVFKGVDVEKLADKSFTNNATKDAENRPDIYKEGFIDGYTSKEYDNKEKRFTLEDVNNIVAMCRRKETFNFKDIGFKYSTEEINDFIDNLSTPKKEWKVEIEMEEQHFRTVKNAEGQFIEHQTISMPKLTKNSEGKECYTITKITH